MKTSKLLFVLCAILALVSCGDSKDEPQLEKGGAHVYHTTGKVKYFIATASVSSLNSGDSLTMTIYADGKEVYKQTSSVTEISVGNTLTYSTYKFE